MNTHLEYLYRDAGNDKWFGEVVKRKDFLTRLRHRLRRGTAGLT